MNDAGFANFWVFVALIPYVNIILAVVLLFALKNSDVAPAMLPRSKGPKHPGEMLLEEFLKPIGITQADFAKHLGWSFSRVSEIVLGRSVICARTALCFGDAFGTEPEFWLKLQRDWDLWQAQKRHKRIKPLDRDAA